MAQQLKLQISDIENLIPYERDLYMGMLIQSIEEHNARE